MSIDNSSLVGIIDKDTCHHYLSAIIEKKLPFSEYLSGYDQCYLCRGAINGCDNYTKNIYDDVFLQLIPFYGRK